MLRPLPVARRSDLADVVFWLLRSHKAQYECPMDVRNLADDLGGSVRQLAMRKGSALLFTETLIHGTAVWRSSTPRRALNVRYVSPSLAAAPRRLPHWDEMTPLQQALEEPPYENHDSRPRPDIARLIEEEEAMLRENPQLARPDHHWQWYEAST